MFTKFRINKRELLSGGLLIALGLAVAIQGASYHVGSMARMGPGFFPVMLGVILVFLGVLCLFAGGVADEEEGDDENEHPAQWRGWAAIIFGVIAFIIFGKYGGLVPATFALVFISAMGDRTHTVLSALLLAAFVSVLGIVIFAWGLELQFPMFRWG